MRHYAARQLVSGGWHYTVERGNLIIPEGACAEHGPHPTREDAEECYKKHLLEQAQFVDANPQRLNGYIRETYLCVVPNCEAESTTIAAINGNYRRWRLCSDHSNRETLASLFTVGESWES